MLVSLILPMLLAATETLPVHAAGTLFIAPSSQPAQAVGSTVTYKVNVTGMDPFDSWDISVKSTPAVLNPVSISVANNIVGSVFEVANCINGVGTGCSINDGAGVAHSAAASPTGTAVGGAGLAFTITYKVAGSGFSFLTIPVGLDTIAAGGVTVSHSNIGGVYGTPPTLPMAAFTFSPTMPNQGDKVTFDGSSSSDTNTGASIVSYAWTISPVSGGTPITNTTSQPLMVHTFAAPEAGTFSVALVVEDNLGISSLTATHTITVTQVAPPDFSFSAEMSSLTIHPGRSGSSVLNLQGLNGFTGDVTLSVAGPSGLVTSFDVNPVSVSTASVTSTLTITAHIRPGTYTVTVTAMAGTLVHSVKLTVVVTPHMGANTPK
jgi:hypothetical protein